MYMYLNSILICSLTLQTVMWFHISALKVIHKYKKCEEQKKVTARGLKVIH